MAMPSRGSAILAKLFDLKHPKFNFRMLKSGARTVDRTIMAPCLRHKCHVDGL